MTMGVSNINAETLEVLISQISIAMRGALERGEDCIRVEMLREEIELPPDPKTQIETWIPGNLSINIRFSRSKEIPTDD